MFLLLKHVYFLCRSISVFIQFFAWLLESMQVLFFNEASTRFHGDCFDAPCSINHAKLLAVFGYFPLFSFISRNIFCSLWWYSRGNLVRVGVMIHHSTVTRKARQLNFKSECIGFCFQMLFCLLFVCWYLVCYSELSLQLILVVYVLKWVEFVIVIFKYIWWLTCNVFFVELSTM